MASSRSSRRMWIAVITISVIALVVLTISNRLDPSYQIPVGILAFAAIGAVFCWAFTTDREALWWAIIPGVGAFTLIAALLGDQLIAMDPANDWISGIIVGLGASIIAALLRRPDARTVLVIVAMLSFLVGIAMAPVAALPKVLLIAVDIIIGVTIVLRLRGGPASPQRV